jgi:DNA-binding MarR family transcriptional regulator
MVDFQVEAPRKQLSAPLLEHLARRMRTAMESELGGFDLRARHLIALTLLRELGESGQAELAETLRLDRTNLVGLLNELEAAELIERRRSPEDRRRHTVLLTPTGAERLDEVEGVLAGVEEEVLAALDSEQRDSLHLLLQRAAAGTGSCAAAPPEC